MNEGLLHCARCDTYKNSSEFYRHKNRPEGHAAYCIECEKATPRRYNTGKGQIKGPKGKTGPTGTRKPRRPVEILPKGMLRCSKCKEVKPTYDFHRHSATKRGWAGQCKLCRAPAPKVREQDKYGNFRCTKCGVFKSCESFYIHKNYKNSGF
ncbi:hypothetical protein LCGC14_2129940, partial [marine sediment metagenome]